MLRSGWFPNRRVQRAFDEFGKGVIKVSVERLKASVWERSCNNRVNESTMKLCEHERVIVHWNSCCSGRLTRQTRGDASRGYEETNG